ncbi:MAG: hypothetical protein JRG96_06475 [Deltaproteobacteria bacterium]|nr:hypothetical protein [Deltaproteobacteria bacterium]MBW2420489.1 hypothetical protein [Deltaproteobacteria bacterium]
MTSRNGSGGALVALAILLSALLACDRNIEPLDPSEQARQPNLGRIFPEGSDPDAGRDVGAAARMAPAGGVRGNVGESAPAPGADPISGSIELAASVAGGGPAGAVLFLIARREGQPGPPMAVVREVSPSFPYAFEIGPANLMIPGSSFAGPVLLQARLDSDGNAMTKLPEDLEGSAAEPLQPGDSQVRIVLDRSPR